MSFISTVTTGIDILDKVINGPKTIDDVDVRQVQAWKYQIESTDEKYHDRYELLEQGFVESLLEDGNTVFERYLELKPVGLIRYQYRSRSNVSKMKWRDCHPIERTVEFDNPVIRGIVLNLFVITEGFKPIVSCCKSNTEPLEVLREPEKGDRYVSSLGFSEVIGGFEVTINGYHYRAVDGEDYLSHFTMEIVKVAD